MLRSFAFLFVSLASLHRFQSVSSPHPSFSTGFLWRVLHISWCRKRFKKRPRRLSKTKKQKTLGTFSRPTKARNKCAIGVPESWLRDFLHGPSPIQFPMWFCCRGIPREDPRLARALSRQAPLSLSAWCLLIHSAVETLRSVV